MTTWAMARTSLKASLVYILCSLICLSVISVPVYAAPTAKKPAPTIPQPPHFVVYSDQSQFGIPQASDLKGFNTLILSFLLTSGAADQAFAWTQLSPAQRGALKAGYKAANITLLVSAFGSTEAPTTDGRDAGAMAQSVAGWVKEWGVDGVDVDYEDFKAVAKGTAVSWLETFTTVLRKNLPAGQFVITHAPVAPWFGPGQPYSLLDASIGPLIDWYNVQFYSQGTAYTSCATLVFASGGDFPGTAVMEIVGVIDRNDANLKGNVGGVSVNVENGKGAGVGGTKVVLGKPGTPADVGVPQGGGTGVAGGGGGGTQVAGGGTQVAGDGGGTQEAGGGTQVAGGGTQVAGGGQLRRGQDPHINGFLEPQALAQCLAKAKSKGWNAGVMAWEFPDADTTWIETVRSKTWPVKQN